MSVLFLEYPKCSTCQKAKKWLNERTAAQLTNSLVKQQLLSRSFLYRKGFLLFRKINLCCANNFIRNLLCIFFPHKERMQLVNYLFLKYFILPDRCF